MRTIHHISNSAQCHKYWMEKRTGKPNTNFRTYLNKVGYPKIFLKVIVFNLKHEQVKRIIPCAPAPITQLPQRRAQMPALITSTPSALSPRPGDHLETNSRKLYKVVILAPHSSTLAWKIPWMEEPGRLQSTGSLRVRHNWVTSLSLFTFTHWRRKWQPSPVFLPGESQGRGSLVGCSLWGH